jgi:DNA (cytosine-5)-methyltransferase 1
MTRPGTVTADEVAIGSLCSGYGGLDMAVMAVFGGRLAWCADNDRHVVTILARRFPGVPNHGDIRTLDWQTVEPIDIVCAGFPCQDISTAGRGAGIKRGTRSGIWINIVQGIRLLQPRLVIVENVAAIRRRGIDRVLGDLAQAGYDTVWTSLRASDVGAAHRRERVFILAYRPEGQALLAAADTGSQRRQRRPAGSQTPSGRPPGRSERPGHNAVPRRLGQRALNIWGPYAAAIRRWEQITGRSAPPPTERGTRGQPRLSPAFSEWLMGLPAGFVTDLGLPYGAQHRAIGNGVVPQQAEAALRHLVSLELDVLDEEDAAEAA